MDRLIKDTTTEVADMQARFRTRASAVTKSSMPPLEGDMRRQWIRQKEADYQDFLMISDCDVDFTDGILHLTLDLRPKICDATIRGSSSEIETQIAMNRISKSKR